MGIFLTPERYAERLEQAREAARAVGRDPAVLVASIYIWAAPGRDPEEAVKVVSGMYGMDFSPFLRYLLVGDEEKCLERLAEFARAGCEEVALAIADPDPGEGMRMASRLLEGARGL